MGEEGTTRWYDANARAFAERTQSLDMGHLYDAFLTHLPQGGTILDAGCGAGRDSKAFLERGFKVTMIDASRELARVAEVFTGQPVMVMCFQDIDWSGEFDGIWACASLLHVPRAELPGVFDRLGRALKADGILYASFKRGSGERVDESSGRHFTDVAENDIKSLINQIPELELLEIWTNEDSRPGEKLAWVNLIMRRNALPEVTHRSGRL